MVKSRQPSKQAPKQPENVCWDSNCFCAWFSEEQGRYEICDAIIDAARKNEIKLYTSFLTLAEVVKIPGLYPSEAEDRIADFFRNPYVIKVAVDWFVTRIARDLRNHYKLKGRDAIHLATAIHMKVDTLHTYDSDDLLKLDSHIKGVSLRITEPNFEYQTKLPE